ncbi:MAG: tRNA (5-methoxyuridine) 34 synthase [uncultured Thiotrichaceae bacterium]|uniref:tRNA U34 carboxymethyltransferase n=1 Tax=uncultured Thiotrichaceae bacterium TaxID=298394 RepID=A0A6S6TGN3_9GAMM|nr:MAG: tRNA (5-methoxyuridine) 34 synthase [uncultured Thiotrichaceae bacterium]
MIDFSELYADLNETRLHPWTENLQEHINKTFSNSPHGKLQEWLHILEHLPEITPSLIDMGGSRITAGQATDINKETYEQLLSILKTFHPWRKGPYELFGIHIDTEWRSDWKWDRIHQHIQPLEDKLVLDIGCGNGYHMWRMHDEGARLVIGADPSQFFLMQFSLFKHYLGKHLPVHLIPAKSEDLPNFQQQGFDTVFSMGVLYHRKSPFQHLEELKQCLRPSGELVLETLVIEGDEDDVLVPENRYAKMRNVWFIPSVPLLTRWLRRLGFIDIKVIDVSQTSLEEQRATEWMTFESLSNFLDPEDRQKTIEGYPAPLRASISCRKP